MRRTQFCHSHLAVHLVALFPLLAGLGVALSVAPQSPVERLGDDNELMRVLKKLVKEGEKGCQAFVLLGSLQITNSNSP